MRGRMIQALIAHKYSPLDPPRVPHPQLTLQRRHDQLALCSNLKAEHLPQCKRNAPCEAGALKKCSIGSIDASVVDSCRLKRKRVRMAAMIWSLLSAFV